MGVRQDLTASSSAVCCGSVGELPCFALRICYGTFHEAPGGLFGDFAIHLLSLARRTKVLPSLPAIRLLLCARHARLASRQSHITKGMARTGHRELHLVTYTVTVYTP
jgi:hypothetical protein